MDAHHGDAKRSDAAESQGGVDLGEVLDGGEEGGEDAAEVGPCLEGRRAGVADGEGGDEHDGGVDDADYGDS